MNESFIANSFVRHNLSNQILALNFGLSILYKFKLHKYVNANKYLYLKGYMEYFCKIYLLNATLSGLMCSNLYTRIEKLSYQYLNCV